MTLYQNTLLIEFRIHGTIVQQLRVLSRLMTDETNILLHFVVSLGVWM